MKCTELKSAIERLEPLWSIAGGPTPPALLDLQRLLAARPNETIAKFSASIFNARPNANSVSSSNLEDISKLADILAGALSGSAIAKELGKLSPALQAQSLSSVDDLVEALSAKKTSKIATPPAKAAQDVVQRHCRALESALGDDVGFAAAYQNLQSDPDVQLAELVALAKQFGFARATSKKAALKKILSRQQTLMTSRAKTAATGGRIAG